MPRPLRSIPHPASHDGDQTIADANETAIRVPLRFMRRDGSRSPRWDKVRHLAIDFRNPGQFVLDDFTFRSQPGTTAELGVEELARIAFPDTTVHSVNKTQFHPQDGFSGIVCEGIEKPNFGMPLRELCGGQRIPMNRYWQAATVVRMMLALPQYREKLHAVFEGNPPADDWDAFERDWLEECGKTYGTGKEQGAP